MTRTKATVKRRQQRRRLEREAQKAREAEQHQQGEDEAEESAENQEEEEEEDRAPAEEPIRAQEGTSLEQEDNDDEGEKEERQGGREEEEEGDGDGDDDEGQLLLTDYEKQRERRIEENAAKLAALNLPSIASSFGPSRRSQRQSSVRKSNKDDDYLPSGSSEDSDSDACGSDEENVDPLHPQGVDGDYDDDQALQQAIALSLTAPADNVTDTKSRVPQTRKRKRQVLDKSNSTKKRRKGRQQQFTSDEIAAFFAIIDERGNGKFSVAELERIIRSHDFTWSKQEISDMIDIFDDNKDGQLDFSEFQGIFGRMNMLKMDVP